MKKFISHLLVLSVLSFAHISHADVLHGLVVAVADGDTITVLDESKQQHKIRLMGIDAPEKKQAYGQRSKESLSELVYMKDVEVTWTKRDRYGRTVGQVSFDGTDMCLEQIKRGMAWHYKQYQREQAESDRSLYSDSESLARELKIGLWHDETPIEPSSFRHNKL
jgi:endonuclease YncB( thermonuclease family)